MKTVGIQAVAPNFHGYISKSTLNYIEQAATEQKMQLIRGKNIGFGNSEKILAEIKRIDSIKENIISRLKSYVNFCDDSTTLQILNRELFFENKNVKTSLVSSYRLYKIIQKRSKNELKTYNFIKLPHLDDKDALSYLKNFTESIIEYIPPLTIDIELLSYYKICLKKTMKKSSDNLELKNELQEKINDTDKKIKALKLKRNTHKLYQTV